MAETPTGYIRVRGGRLQAVVTHAGRKFRRGTGCSVGEEAVAERFLAELLRQLGKAPAPKPGPGEPDTFQSWGERWIAERRARGIISVSDEEAQLKYHAFPQLGATPLRALTKAQMIEWVRGLRARLTASTGKPLSPRYVHHVASTVKRMLSEAVDVDLLVATPCVWKTKRDLPAKRDQNSQKRRAGGFEPWEVHAIITDDRIPEDRRVQYALDFLTGMRPGEVFPRCWRDVDLTAEPLGRLDVTSAWNSRARIEKGTKTLVDKVIPLHPDLVRVLEAWRAEGWKRYVGRDPRPEDLILPADRGGRRGASHSNKLFQDDVRRLGLREGRTHYESRSTFRSLARAGGAELADLNLITHPSPREASDLYNRLNSIWPALCRAVLCVRIAPKPPAPKEEVTSRVTVGRGEPESPGGDEGMGPIAKARDTGFESGHSRAGTRGNATGNQPDRAGSGRAGALNDAGSHAGVTPAAPAAPRVFVACNAQDAALAAFLEASGTMAAAAVERGDLAAARELLERALRSVDRDAPVIRLAPNVG